MLKKRTTFVLGAGSSSELGFPLGRELQARIQARAKGDHKALLTSSLHSLERPTHPVLRFLGDRGHDKADVLMATERIADGLSLAPSIDTFLLNNQHNQLVVDCGKAYVLQTIVEAERRSPLSSEDHARNFCEASVDEGRKRYQNTFGLPWTACALDCSYLMPIWREISSSHTIENVTEIFRNVSFVNFNYDRSLEAAFLYLLVRNFGLTASQAAKVVDSIDVVRPYGSPHGVERFSQATPGFGVVDGIQFADGLTNLRTLTESVDEKIADDAKRLVADSQILVFLGFAFHPQNFDLLQVRDCDEKSVFFSHFQDSSENRDALREELSVRLGPCRSHGTRISTLQIHGCNATSRQTLVTHAQAVFRSR